MDGHLKLHDARVKRNVALSDLSAKTSLSSAVVRKIDEGRFGELPPGLYARAYVKSFAAEVGLNPNEALKAVEHLLPGAPDPLPMLREQQGPTFSDRLVAMVERVRKKESKAPSPVEDVVREHIIEDSTDDPHDHGAVFHVHLMRLGAAAIDALVLFAMNVALVLLVALGTGLPPSSLVRHGSAALGTLCAVPTVLYFILFNGIGGRTLGRRLCRLPEPPLHAPLTLDAILRRSVAPGSPLDAHRDGLSRPALAGRG